MRIFFLLSALVWAELISAQTPTSIEAVEYDPTGQRWFVSNGSSLLVTDNQGIDWSFFGEAQATHGMEVMGNHLFASECGRHKDMMLGRAVLVRIAGAADPIAASAHMCDL